uniref:Peptidase M16 N-terminal domain-containing protein n=1 Tax=Romanomermis culicivorax TaxID=13658 RepID=A0A915I4Z9_ROMCU
MLIQDQFSQESAASAIVDVGSMNDPTDQQGMAHLCEHMLFLGTDKFPLESSFNSFVKINGGRWNGATKLDRTEFVFKIYSPNFMDALDRSRTLAHPVESILHQLASPNHNYTKFLTGNRRSLTEKLSNDEIIEMRKKKKNPKKPTANDTSPETFRKLRRNLAKFFADFYSPNRMSLVVVHNESLDFMTEKIIEFFGQMNRSGPDASNFLDLDLDPDMDTMKQVGSDVVKK